MKELGLGKMIHATVMFVGMINKMNVMMKDACVVRVLAIEVG